jgi:hypothetical protein
MARDEKMKSPPWHEKILKEREKAFAAGKVKVSDWEEAKKRIKKQLSSKRKNTNKSKGPSS